MQEESNLNVALIFLCGYHSKTVVNYLNLLAEACISRMAG